MSNFLLKCFRNLLTKRYNLIFIVIKQIFLFSFFLVNSADRVIRVYDSGAVLKDGKDGDPEPTQKLQDLVNK